MKRREFIALLGGAAPRGASAATPAGRRVDPELRAGGS
jgi:hypothetical protein